MYKHGGGTRIVHMCASNGEINQRPWQLGKTNMSFSIASRTQQLGDKLVLNQGRMLQTVTLPRPHPSPRPMQATPDL
jgi:hypothetical protein